LQAESQEKNLETGMQLALGNALDDPSRSSPAFAAAAVKWALSAETSPTGKGDEVWMHEQSIVAAAMIAMRDGDAKMRASHTEWARRIFARALEAEEDPAHRFRLGLRFNSIAMAFAGTIHTAKDSHRT